MDEIVSQLAGMIEASMKLVSVVQKLLIRSVFPALIVANAWLLIIGDAERYSGLSWAIISLLVFVFGLMVAISLRNFFVGTLLIFGSYSTHGWNFVRHIRPMWRLRRKTPFTVNSFLPDQNRTLSFERLFLTSLAAGIVGAAIYIFGDNFFSDIALSFSLLCLSHSFSLIAMFGKAPAIAFLGASTVENAKMQIEIGELFFLRGTVSLIDVTDTSVDLSTIRGMQSIIRTNPEQRHDWRESVRDACEMAKLIVIDARKFSALVSEEIDYLISSENIKKALIITSGATVEHNSPIVEYQALAKYSDLYLQEEDLISTVSERLFR